MTASDRVFAKLDRALTAVFWTALVILFLRPSTLRLSTPFGHASLSSAKNIAIAFGLFWLALAVARPRRYIVRAGLAGPLALFLAAGGISALASSYGPAGERWTALLEAACYGLFFYGSLYVLRGSARARAAAMALVAAAAAVAAVDLAYHARAGLAFIVDQKYPLWDGKNALGLFMAIALALGVSLAPPPSRAGAWAAAALALVLIFLCALYSYSRAAWLAMVAAALAMALLRSWKWIWLLLAAAVLLTALPNHRIVRRAFATGNSRDRTATWRVVVWKDAVRMIRANPILGVGPGEFRRACGDYEDINAPTRHLPRDKAGLRYRDHAHNLPLQVAAETGLAGLAALLWGATLVARAAVRGARGMGGLAAGIAAALAAFAAYSCVDCSWTGRFTGSSFMHINLIVALLAAMAYSGAALRSSDLKSRISNHGPAE